MKEECRIILESAESKLKTGGRSEMAVYRHFYCVDLLLS